MALEGAYHNHKIRRLGRSLRVKPWAALGLMEAIWHWAQKSARTGRIELDQWEDLADFLQWEEPSDSLRQTLLDAKFIDAMDGWDWIHDWHLHAPKSVREALEYIGIPFANGEETRRWKKRPQPKVADELRTSCGKTENSATEVAEKPEKVAASARARPEPEPEPEPEPVNLQHHHQRARDFEPSEGPDPTALVAEAVEAVAAVWPSTRRGDVKYARRRWEVEAAADVAGVAAWCERIRATGAVHAEAHKRCAEVDRRHFVPNLERWVDSGDYARTPPDPVERHVSQRTQKETQAQQILAKVAAMEAKKRAN